MYSPTPLKSSCFPKSFSNRAALLSCVCISSTVFFFHDTGRPQEFEGDRRVVPGILLHRVEVVEPGLCGIVEHRELKELSLFGIHHDSGAAHDMALDTLQEVATKLAATISVAAEGLD